MKIPIKEIAVINRQRKQMDMGKLQELAASIKENDLFHPIVLREPFDHELAQMNEEHKWVLSMGGRRVAAHVLLGRLEIEATFKRNLDPVRAEICELDENLKRENITWQEEVAARARIVELHKHLNPDATLQDMEEATGVSAAQISRDVNLNEQLKKDPSLKEAGSKGSAMRRAQFKHEIGQRVAAIKSIDITDLRSKLLVADASQFVRTIPTQSIDFVFTDLPYGIDYFSVRKDGKHALGAYDDRTEKVLDFLTDIIPQALRVVKPTGWVAFFMCYEWHQWLQDQIRDTCKTHFQYRSGDSSYCMAKTEVGFDGTCDFFVPELPPSIWTRRGKGNHGHWPELHASNRYEMLVIVNGGKAKYAKKPVENVLDYAPLEGERLHEHQKPHDLCQEVISRFTVVGERVLDFCMGSGAHLAAAASMGRDFIGCDSNPDNLPKALQLIAQFYSKPVADAVKPTQLSLVNG